MCYCCYILLLLSSLLTPDILAGSRWANKGVLVEEKLVSWPTEAVYKDPGSGSSWGLWPCDSEELAWWRFTYGGERASWSVYVIRYVMLLWRLVNFPLERREMEKFTWEICFSSAVCSRTRTLKQKAAGQGGAANCTTTAALLAASATTLVDASRISSRGDAQAITEIERATGIGSKSGKGRWPEREEGGGALQKRTRRFYEVVRGLASIIVRLPSSFGRSGAAGRLLRANITVAGYIFWGERTWMKNFTNDYIEWWRPTGERALDEWG